MRCRLPGIIDSQISGGRCVLGVMLPRTVVDSNESEISWFGVPLVSAALVFRSSRTLAASICAVSPSWLQAVLLITFWIWRSDQ